MWKVGASLTSKVNVYQLLSQTQPLAQHILKKKKAGFSVTKNLFYYFHSDLFSSSVQCMANEREAGNHMEVIKREMRWWKVGFFFSVRQYGPMLLKYSLSCGLTGVL